MFAICLAKIVVRNSRFGFQTKQLAQDIAITFIQTYYLGSFLNWILSHARALIPQFLIQRSSSFSVIECTIILLNRLMEIRRHYPKYISSFLYASLMHLADPLPWVQIQCDTVLCRVRFASSISICHKSKSTKMILAGLKVIQSHKLPQDTIK